MLYMAVDKVLYAVRIPVDLKRLIDIAAASGGVNTSQLVIAALWKYLDKGTTAYPTVANVSTHPAPTMNAAMQKFMEKVEANPVSAVIHSHPDTIETVPQKSCTECDGTMASKTVKGRGIIYACPDMGCPMYGLERK